MQALRIPESAGYKVRYPILNRTLNKRDWASSQQLMDDIEVILSEAMKTELNILPRDYSVSSSSCFSPVQSFADLTELLCGPHRS